MVMMFCAEVNRICGCFGTETDFQRLNSGRLMIMRHSTAPYTDACGSQMHLCFHFMFPLIPVFASLLSEFIDAAGFSASEPSEAVPKRGQSVTSEPFLAVPKWDCALNSQSVETGSKLSLIGTPTDSVRVVSHTWGFITEALPGWQSNCQSSRQGSGIGHRCGEKRAP